MQPDAHDIMPTGMNRGDLWESEAAVGEQDQVRAQGHPSDRLVTEVDQFLTLWLSQGDVDHLSSLRESEAAQTMPIF
jgi:hypothetical protein